MVRLMNAVAVLALCAGLAVARADDKADQPFDDATFVTMAASDGLHEVELGKIAEGHAKSAEVKKFAEMLVKDHTKANAKLKAAAKAAGIPCPEKLSETHAKHVEHFKNYKGKNFDADFVHHEVTDHKKAIALFTRASKEAKHKELKDFATETLPVLKKHLEAAEALDKHTKE